MYRDQTREHEPGVAYYAFAKSVEEPNTYVVVEVYRDAAAHAAHGEADFVKESIPRASRLFERDTRHQAVRQPRNRACAPPAVA